MSENSPRDNQIQEDLIDQPLPPQVAEIDEKLKADPKDPQLWMERGRAFKKQMNLRLAIENYSVGLSHDPFNMLLYRHRGHAYINIRRYREGAADLEMALRLDPSLWENWYHLALAYHLMGDFERAISVYETCLNATIRGDLYTIDDEGITNDDLVIALVDWYCLSLLKLGRIDDFKKAVTLVHKDMKVTDYSAGYFQRVLVYNGTYQVDEIIKKAKEEEGHMFATMTYGLAVYCEKVLGDTEKARTIRKEIAEVNNPTWCGFAVLASLEDKIAEKKKGG